MSSQKKLIEDILSSYDTILQHKNFIKEELNLVKLGTTGYSNAKYDTDGTQNDFVNKPLLDDIQNAAKSAGIVATITTAKTGHNEKTTTGNISRHMNGTGVDVSILNGIGAGGANGPTNGNADFRELGTKLKNALVSMGYKWNSESGNSKAVLWQTNTGGNHFNHLHISNNSGESSGLPASGDTSTTTSGDTSTTTSGDTSTTTSPTSTGGGGAAEFAKSIGSKILGVMGIKESFEPSSFGKHTQFKSGKAIIPKGHNSKIKSPVSGTIVNITSNKSCINQTVIKFSTRQMSGYLEYCGITKPSVKLGDRVSHGDLLGDTNSNITVTLYSERNQKLSIGTEKENNTDDKKGIKTLFNLKSKDDKDKKVERESPVKTGNEYSKILVKGYNDMKKSFYPSQKKVDENIERIKGLLK
jgi:hypothetical protein